MPDIERLRELLSYDSATGTLQWLVNRRGYRGIKAGDVAGHRNKINGYIEVRIDGELFGAHRIAWALMTGQWPDEMDHKNRDRGDNRWSNLRLATRSQNIANAPARKNNVLGLKGVTLDARRGKYRARIDHNGEKHWIGYFDTAEDAADAYRTAAARLKGNFAYA